MVCITDTVVKQENFLGSRLLAHVFKHTGRGIRVFLLAENVPDGFVADLVHAVAGGRDLNLIHGVLNLIQRVIHLLQHSNRRNLIINIKHTRIHQLKFCGLSSSGILHRHCADVDILCFAVIFRRFKIAVRAVRFSDIAVADIFIFQLGVALWTDLHIVDQVPALCKVARHLIDSVVHTRIFR